MRTWFIKQHLQTLGISWTKIVNAVHLHLLFVQDTSDDADNDITNNDIQNDNNDEDDDA